MAKVTVIVKMQGKTMTFEYDDVEIKQERGVTNIYRGVEAVATILGAVPADAPVRGNSLVPPYRKSKRGKP